MAKILGFQIVPHGWTQGGFTAFAVCKPYRHVATGSGMNAKAAYANAVEAIIAAKGVASEDFPKNPRGIRATDEVPVRLRDTDTRWYVSICYNLGE